MTRGQEIVIALLVVPVPLVVLVAVLRGYNITIVMQRKGQQ